MKLKSLILGSVAAVGLSTAGYAADLGVLTSLDVCDALGLSGLTISSDTNCLQISGEVKYEFSWGDYRHHAVRTGANTGTAFSDRPVAFTPFGVVNTMWASASPAGAGPYAGVPSSQYTDWDSKVETWLKFVGTADSDFGPASATIKLKSISQSRVINEGNIEAGGGSPASTSWTFDVDTQPFDIDEAYVSIGDATVIMAGKKSGIGNFGDSKPFNYLELFGWSDIDNGILVEGDEDQFGGHSIQVVSDLGNGLNIAVGLENLQGETGPAEAGTLVGSLNYAGDSITAHLTGAAIGVLDGTVDAWLLHAGATGTFDAYKIRGTVAYGSLTPAGVYTSSRFHGLLSGEATFDIFKIALSAEYARTDTAAPVVTNSGFGFGGSVGVQVTEGVEINVGARVFNGDFALPAPLDRQTATQVAAQLIAAVTETVKITGTVGAYFNDDVAFNGGNSLFYGSAELAWAPGGGFTSSIKGEINSESAYKVTFKAAKAFQ